MKRKNWRDTDLTLYDVWESLPVLSNIASAEQMRMDAIAAIDRAQHEDIKKTYETLMCGSRNHLRGFAQNIEAVTGKPYVPQVLTQDEVDAILDSPMEKCGPKKLPPGLHLRTNGRAN